jgi:hypothetical protein
MDQETSMSFCCEQMDAQWQAGVVAMTDGGEAIQASYEEDGQIVEAFVLISHCPWCGSKFKLKDELE